MLHEDFTKSEAIKSVRNPNRHCIMPGIIPLEFFIDKTPGMGCFISNIYLIQIDHAYSLPVSLDHHHNILRPRRIVEAVLKRRSKGIVSEEFEIVQIRDPLGDLISIRLSECS